MTIRRITVPTRYIGSSNDVKPHAGTAPQDAVGGPPNEGSTFTEYDTGRVYVWAADGWQLQETDPLPHLAETLAALLAEVKKIRAGLELVLQTELENV